MGISLTDSFVEAIAALSPADSHRVSVFVDKLIHAPDAAGMRPEIVHDAHDRSIRSFKATRAIRVIGYVDGDETVLLYAARHDEAYRWAREHCFGCSTGDAIVIPLVDASANTARGSADGHRDM